MFKTQMPARPRLKTTEIHTPIGTIHTYAYDATYNTATFEVEYQDIPNIAFWFKSGKSIMGTAKAEYLKAMEATEVSDTEIDFVGQKARMIAYTFKNGTTGQAVMMMVKHRFFVIHQERAHPQDARRFFGSFQLRNVDKIP